ncbi:beta/alpha barrel domain-containing protein [Bythopirellula goksoeyrii]|uniref:Fructose-bisphosphate aldolase n=1 Tax=Bythopirellula goksoeyrii TaxID=1400387 RepID=A0A5B9QAD3_9BACT|nr:hypothetical protein [Bythopirellula goksoeyrii]QEG34560.1 hypothetical protein Pr1d_18410 [Bythopirellula goksoeyrii]
MAKTLDEKLSRIAADPSCDDFIVADAKDADMAFGISAPGRRRNPTNSESEFLTLADYHATICEIVEQGLVDIMLMSVNTSARLTIAKRLFEKSPVTPAIRANDTTDIWLAGGVGAYGTQPSLSFRSATIDHAMCGHANCTPEERRLGADLGLYSITFNNDATLDRLALEAYRAFRIEAEEKGFRHFLEVFPPNACTNLAAEDVPRFVNDSIARALAGVPPTARPIFLKIPYFGPEPMAELVTYDPSLVVGILGGSAGTTYDAFQMLWEAKQHGARAALFGRKINNAEHQLSFIRQLRALADGQAKPEDAVRAYHTELGEMGIRPDRDLETDLKPTSSTLSYAGSTGRTTVK